MLGLGAASGPALTLTNKPQLSHAVAFLPVDKLLRLEQPSPGARRLSSHSQVVMLLDIKSERRARKGILGG